MGKVSTQPFQKPKPLLSPEPIEDKRAQADSKQTLVASKWKHPNISALRDFLPIPGRFNPYLNTEKRQELRTQLVVTQIIS